MAAVRKTLLREFWILYFSNVALILFAQGVLYPTPLA